MRNLDAIIKAYDVRGTYPDQLNAELARAVGAAFVRVVGAAGSAIAVGRDMRPSGPELVSAFAEGATEYGKTYATTLRRVAREEVGARSFVHAARL